MLGLYRHFMLFEFCNDVFIHHTRHHEVEQVAVECPFISLIGRQKHRIAIGRGYDGCVLVREFGHGLTIFELDKHAVQVHWMSHHRIVDIG